MKISPVSKNLNSMKENRFLTKKKTASETQADRNCFSLKGFQDHYFPCIHSKQ